MIVAKRAEASWWLSRSPLFGSLPFESCSNAGNPLDMIKPMNRVSLRIPFSDTFHCYHDVLLRNFQELSTTHWPRFITRLTRLPVSYTHLRAHETRHDIVFRL